MSKTTVFLGLLLLGGGGYAIHENWDEIDQSLGLQELSVDRVKAIGMVKRANNLDPFESNEQVIATRIKVLRGDVQPGDWTANAPSGRRCVVQYRYTHDGKVLEYRFEANFETLEVKRIDAPDEAPASPPPPAAK